MGRHQWRRPWSIPLCWYGARCPCPPPGWDGRGNGGLGRVYLLDRAAAVAEALAESLTMVRCDVPVHLLDGTAESAEALDVPLETYASMVVTATSKVVGVVHLDGTSWTWRRRPQLCISRQHNAQCCKEHGAQVRTSSPRGYGGSCGGCDRSPPRRGVPISWMGQRRQRRLRLCPQGDATEAVEAAAVPLRRHVASIFWSGGR